MSNRARAVVARVALPTVFFVVVVVAAGCGGGGAHPITEFALPAISSNPVGITAGPDGNLWFTENNGARIGRITPAGEIDEFAGLHGQPYGITAGPDGNLWFTEVPGDQIGRITPLGAVTEFPVNDSGVNLVIAAGTSGDVWFGGVHAIPTIGRIDANGAVTELRLPATAGSEGEGMVVTADGNVWFTNGWEIVRVTPDGMVTEFPTSTGGRPYGMAVGVNGELWFATFADSLGQIGRITPDGTISVIPLPAGVVTDYAIAVGPDGSIWFTEVGGNKIGCLSPAGNVTHYPIPTESSFPRAIAVAANGSIWFTEYWGGKIGRITP